MDNQTNISDTILGSSVPSESINVNGDDGFFSSLKNINITTWIVIILILAFLGFNIFVYLAKGTQTIADLFAPITEKIFGTGVAVTSQAVDVSAEGTKAVVSKTSEVIQGSLSAVQDITPGGTSGNSNIQGQPIAQQTHQKDVMQQTALNQALNNAQNQEPDYQAHEASSSVHSAGKSGWCFIGEDRGFRSCAQVGVNDTCMSGDIFPSQEICMNPNLRS